MMMMRIRTGYLYSLVIRYSIFLTLPLICIYKYLWCLSEGSLKLASDVTETGRSLSYPLSKLSNTFAFKIEDRKGRMHRFTCGMLLFLLITYGIHKMAVICGIPFSMHVAPCLIHLGDSLSSLFGPSSELSSPAPYVFFILWLWS